MLETSKEKMPNGGKQTCEAHKKARKHVIKQTGEDKCRFGLNVHSSIGLELDDTQTHARTCRQVCKDVKKAKWVA